MSFSGVSMDNPSSAFFVFRFYATIEPCKSEGKGMFILLLN